MTAWELAHNLQVRVDDIRAAWPGIVVGEIGDQAHQAEHSDHNPDARGVVHAFDVMTLAYQTSHGIADDAVAMEILAWLLSAPTDLEYVIHNRTIYTVANGFRPQVYAGSDPHTDHVHVSGLHGSVGRNSATGTGYSLAAEAMTPEGFDMPLTDADAKTLTDHVLQPLNESVGGAVQDTRKWVDALTNQQIPALSKAITALSAQLVALATDVAALKAAQKTTGAVGVTLPTDVTVTGTLHVGKMS